jgi:hypothetical protein
MVSVSAYLSNQALDYLCGAVIPVASMFFRAANCSVMLVAILAERLRFRSSRIKQSAKRALNSAGVCCNRFLGGRDSLVTR